MTMYILTEYDLYIIEIIEKYKEFEIKKVGDLEMEYIYKLGIHKIYLNMPIIYDIGASEHFIFTKDDKKKTKRLSPSQTINIIRKPKIILPNFSKGSNNSYLYVGDVYNLSISIVEVLLIENKIRVTHGGFEIKDPSYLKKAKELRNTILEGRLQD